MRESLESEILRFNGSIYWSVARSMPETAHTLWCGILAKLMTLPVNEKKVQASQFCSQSCVGSLWGVGGLCTSERPAVADSFACILVSERGSLFLVRAWFCQARNDKQNLMLDLLWGRFVLISAPEIAQIKTAKDCTS